MDHEVTVTTAAARPTAVVPATTTWAEYPAMWPGLLGEVWACLRAGGVTSGCPNIMLYRDDGPLDRGRVASLNVEVGVELRRPCELTGRVVRSTLPAGPVATTIHRGPYAGLASAHEAVIAWCAARGRGRAGPRWEIYGPHRDDQSQLETTVYYLLA